MPRDKKVILTTAKFVLFWLCMAVLTLSIGSSNQDEKKLFVGNEVHKISLQEARLLVENFRQGISPDAVIGGFFGGDAIRTLLSRPGVVGIRAYFARKQDGSLTLVLVGVDEKGEDIIEADGPMNRWFPCPPFCPTNSELIQGHYAFEDR